MWRLVFGGLGLIAAAAVHLVDYLVGRDLAGIVGGVGAWLGATAAALAYRSLTKTARRAVPAAALALLGVVASAWTVGMTVHLALRPGPRSRVDLGRWPGPDGIERFPPSYFAVVGTGAGLALLAWAVWRAGVVPRVVGLALAAVAVLGSVTGDPAAPYLLAGAPLGVALVSSSVRAHPDRTRRRPRRTTGINQSDADPGRLSRLIVPVSLAATVSVRCRIGGTGITCTT